MYINDLIHLSENYLNKALRKKKMYPPTQFVHSLHMCPSWKRDPSSLPLSEVSLCGLFPRPHWGFEGVVYLSDCWTLWGRCVICEFSAAWITLTWLVQDEHIWQVIWLFSSQGTICMFPHFPATHHVWMNLFLSQINYGSWTFWKHTLCFKIACVCQLVVVFLRCECIYSESPNNCGPLYILMSLMQHFCITWQPFFTISFALPYI